MDNQREFGPGQTPKLWLGISVAAALLVWAAAIQAQPAITGQWQAQGPAPALDGQVENVVPDDEVVGAVHVVLPHPSDPDVLYIGGVNAGVWKTTNATAASPNWVRLTDQFPSLSIGALAFDSADTTNQTIYAGIGRFSSLGSRGGDRAGLLKSTDGGQTWTVLDGGGTLIDKNISGLAVNGNNIVVSVNFAVPFSFGEVGIFRSTDGGQSFTVLTLGDGSASPLPGGVSHDLVRDPSNASRLFTSVAFANLAGGANGIYRSDNFGASWTRVSSPAIEALFTDGGGNNLISNIEFAVGNTNNVFVGLVQQGRLGGVFRSTNGGSSWSQMSLPTTTEAGGNEVGIHPGGQGSIHMSIVADPTDPDIVYVGGDRQPFFTEFGGSGPFFPNSIGANDFSGRLFRGDASLAPANQWTPLTHTGTASASSPHADSREMAFDAAGDLIEADDGGIYRRTQPRSAAGDWFSINGDLGSTEYHGIAYDAVSDIIIGGAQDTGTTEQVMPDGNTFISVSTADGGDPAVDDVSSPTQSTRYSSNQFLGGFRRRIVDAGNTVQSTVFPALNPVGGSAPISTQFYTPIAVNAVEGDRLLIGGSNSLYESLDRGDTVTEIAPGQRVNAIVGDPLIYGVPGNANLIYAAVTFPIGGGNREQALLLRTQPPPAALNPVTLPAGQDRIIDLAVDPAAPGNVFAITADQVFRSTNFGNSWTDITANLIGQNPGELRSMAFIPSGGGDLLTVGTNRGVFVALAAAGSPAWGPFGGNLPNAPVFELEYDGQDNALVAGLLGRGAWKFQPVDANADVVFADSFETP